MLVQGAATFRCFLWLTALDVVLLPSSVSAVWLLLLLSLLNIDILKTVVVLWCLSALTHFDSSPFSPPHVPLLCRCVWMHWLACITHEGVTLADLTEKKKGRFGWFSQSSDTHGKSCGFPPVFSSYCVCLCVCACGFYAQTDQIQKSVLIFYQILILGKDKNVHCIFIILPGSNIILANID